VQNVRYWLGIPGLLRLPISKGEKVQKFRQLNCKTIYELNKMTQLSPDRSLGFNEPFSRSAYPGCWLEGSRGIFRALSPQKSCRLKMRSFSSCGTVTLPIKKRGWRP
jgi:hypothetical protein